MSTSFSRRNETAPSKCLVRDARVKLAQLYLQTVNPSYVDLYSLPARLGLFEKALKPALAGVDSWKWTMFEREKAIWRHIRNPFGQGRCSPHVSYLHGDMQVTPRKLDAPQLPTIFDGDYCGYLDDQIMRECVLRLPEDSLLMLTLGTRIRTAPWNLVHPVANLLRRGARRKVSVEEVGDTYVAAVEAALTARGVPFARLVTHHYTNTHRVGSHGTPMVLLGWHLAAQSPLAPLVTLDTLGLTRPLNTAKLPTLPSTMTTTNNRQRTNIRSSLRANIAKLLVANKSTLGITNVQIDRLLRVPAYTAAGYDASAKRYGSRVLQIAGATA